MTDKTDPAELLKGTTPGPWLTTGTQTEGDDPGYWIVGSNLGGLIGAALPWPTEIDSGDFSRVVANGELMRATPDLAAEVIALRAEVDRLNHLIDDTAQHWLNHFVSNPPIQWEGAIDGAMLAACETIATLRAHADVLAVALETLQVAGNSTLAAMDELNAKNGTHLGGPAFFRLGIAIASADTTLANYRKAKP